MLLRQLRHALAVDPLDHIVPPLRGEQFALLEVVLDRGELHRHRIRLVPRPVDIPSADSPGLRQERRRDDAVIVLDATGFLLGEPDVSRFPLLDGRERVGFEAKPADRLHLDREPASILRLDMPDGVREVVVVHVSDRNARPVLCFPDTLGRVRRRDEVGLPLRRFARPMLAKRMKASREFRLGVHGDLVGLCRQRALGDSDIDELVTVVADEPFE